MNGSHPEVNELGVLAFKQRLDQGENLVVLDVREDHERAYATIALPATARELPIPLGQVASRFEEIEAEARGRSMVVYCHHGQRSMVAATWLARRGLVDVHNLDGGIEAWSVRVDRDVRRY